MATLAIVFALVSMAAGCRRESAEQALRGDIASLQAAIESRDAGEMAGFLAEDFVGNDGLDRDGAQRLAAVYFMRHASIGVTRQAERRVGQEWVSPCAFRWSPSP